MWGVHDAPLPSSYGGAVIWSRLDVELILN